ncbi:hypothetical protein BGZ89_005851, partial [Linnemannia elongata]
DGRARNLRSPRYTFTIRLLAGKKFFRILDDVRLREIQAALETSNRFCQAYKNIREHEADKRAYCK